jgi:DNA-binding CsgD family transcriptional regulator
VLRSAGDGYPVDRVPTLEVLIRARLACGRLDEAASAVETLGEVAGAVATNAIRAKAALSRGLLAAARGEGEPAKLLMEDAIDRFERCRARFDAACARIELANVLLALGRPVDANREARAAHDCLRELGARVDAERAQRLIRPQPGVTDSEARAPVSPREREVLRLLVEGLTNREISERLFISEHTVHRHVTNILRKLNVPTRAAAAAYAVREGVANRE